MRGSLKRTPTLSWRCAGLKLVTILLAESNKKGGIGGEKV